MKRKQQFRRSVRIVFYTLAVLIVVLAGIFFSTSAKNQHKQQQVYKATFPPKKIITPTPLPTVQGTVGPVFLDNFAHNNNGWSLANSQGYTRVLEAGSLTLSSSNHTVLIESVPTATTFTNFTLTATFAMVQGDENDSVGFYLRGDSNLDHDYRIDFFGNNMYAISKEAINTNNKLVQDYLIAPTQTLLLKPLGQNNVVQITMQDANVSLTINGTLLSTAMDSDSSYTRGQIAIFVSNGSTSDGATAELHTIVIYNLPKKEAQ